MKPGVKIHGWKLSTYQPDPDHPRYVVDCTLRNMDTTRDIFWSLRKNSYVLAEIKKDSMWANRPAHDDTADRYFWRGPDGGHVQLLSINGAGEVRWDVTKDRIEADAQRENEPWWNDGLDGAEQLAAARHFGLIEPKAGKSPEWCECDYLAPELRRAGYLCNRHSTILQASAGAEDLLQKMTYLVRKGIPGLSNGDLAGLADLNNRLEELKTTIKS